ncbi:HPF/RaiA family ribosome-associated protein [Chlamydia avium]|nr:sigma 54 modulation/S30EA ribosomal C-terminal domain-containing protein [Chlamydia avium]EPP36559.1 sigma 54 modulation / S30EA ribosomal family protein [Chlamydia psittaci 10_743_SC13]EPP38786.1 sigma 54 modulation / S30EA ribosomal family protein [Chlamydia avium]
MRHPRKQSPKKSSPQKDNNVNVTITGRSFHISYPLRQLIMEKSRQLPVTAIHVVLTSHKEKQGTEVHILASKGKESFQVKTHNNNPYSAVISAFKKIRTLTHKYQEIRLDKKKHDLGLSKKEEHVLQLEEADHQYDDVLPIAALDAWDSLKCYGYIPNAMKKHLSKKKVPLPILSEEEAIRKFASSQDKVLVFLNEKEHKIQLIHKQNNDNYVIIEPIIAPGFHIT